MQTPLVTGATGFLGRDVVHALVQANPDLRVVCLIRASDDLVLQRRLLRVVAGLSEGEARRVSALRGDIEQERLGLSEETYRTLPEKIDRVLHIAATTNFDHSLDEARRINVGGTRHAIELAKALKAAGRSGRLDYVGTAYVAGDRRDVCREDELDKGQGFRNTYERSKFEAESLCRQAGGVLPIALYRPAIIVGDSRDGTTRSYKTIYWPMKMLVKLYGLWPSLLTRVLRLPVRPGCRLDIVPVDYVARAVAALWARDEAIGRCYHLAAGPAAPTIEEVVNLSCDHFGVARLGYLDPEGPIGLLGRRLAPLVERANPRLWKNVKLMAAYTRENPRFDVSNATAAGFVAPSVHAYFERLLRFARQDNFGEGSGREK